MANFYTAISKLFRAIIDNADQITYTTGLTVVPASGAPGAYAKALADATPTVSWWACALSFGNLSAAGAAVFNYQLARGEAGAGSTIVTDARLHQLATGVVPDGIQWLLSFPVMVAALTGAAIRQTTASGKTLDVSLFYATGLDN